MKLFKFEAYSRNVYIRTPIGALWLTLPQTPEQAPFGHPEGKGWGAWRDEGEAWFTAGPVLGVLTPRSVVLRERQQWEARGSEGVEGGAAVPAE